MPHLPHFGYDKDFSQKTGFMNSNFMQKKQERSKELTLKSAHFEPKNDPLTPFWV